MKPDVVVDIGNSRMKWGRCVADEIAHTASLPPDDVGAWEPQLVAWGLVRPLRWAVASVHPERVAQFRQWISTWDDEVLALDDYQQLVLKVNVDEPRKVGIDRLLNAVAFRQNLPKGTPGIIIDAGTALTVDLLDTWHTFVGGAILPGPRLMFESLHRQTAKLPLITLREVPHEVPPGRNTQAAMTAGVTAATMGGVEFLVREYIALCANPPWVMMTGGALGSLAKCRFDNVANTRTDPMLTLEGIRIAAEGLP